MPHEIYCMCMDCMYGKLTDPDFKELAEEWKEIAHRIEKQLKELRECEK